MTGRVGDILTLVRQKLQADGVKLWLPPYHIDGLGTCDEEIAVSVRGRCGEAFRGWEEELHPFWYVRACVGAQQLRGTQQ